MFGELPGTFLWTISGAFKVRTVKSWPFSPCLPNSRRLAGPLTSLFSMVLTDCSWPEAARELEQCSHCGPAVTGKCSCLYFLLRKGANGEGVISQLMAAASPQLREVGHAQVRGAPNARWKRTSPGELHPQDERQVSSSSFPLPDGTLRSEIHFVERAGEEEQASSQPQVQPPPYPFWSSHSFSGLCSTLPKNRHTSELGWPCL